MESKSLNDYVLEKELGKGQFGVVYKAQRKSDNKTIALKIVDIPNDKPYLVEKTREEVEILKKLADPTCNPFVICYYGSYYNPNDNRFFIEMELVEGDNMKKYVSNLWDNNLRGKVFYYILLIASDILKGLKYSHSKGIIHNDIKLENIMIDKNNVPRIIDYGLSCTIVERGQWGEYCNSTGGTPDYIPPEYISDNIRLPASDLWALGITLYQAATKFEYPYNISSDEPSINLLFDYISTDPPDKLNTPNKQLNNLVNGLLVKNPSTRLTVDQALSMLEEVQKPPEFGTPQKSKTIIQTPQTPQKLQTPDPNFGFLTPEPSGTTKKSNNISNKIDAVKKESLKSMLFV
jgi:serine/threonine protein kinase